MDGQEEAQPTSATKLTYDDFLSFPDDGRRHELIEGEHVVTPSPAERHQRAARELVFALTSYVKASRIGQLYFAPFDVVLSPHDVVVPDVLLVLADKMNTVTQRGVFAAPALVVEILSPGTRRRDEGPKRQLYGRAGVREYWLVDPESRLVTVCRSTGSQLDTVAELAAEMNAALTSPMLPGFNLDLQELFATTSTASTRA